jgi:hypothetical protein
MKALMLALIGVSSLALCITGCGGDSDRAIPTTPSTPATTPTPPQIMLQRVMITGNNALTAVGETSKLTATGTYSDGTTKDISTQCRWSTGDSRVVMVAQDGVITIVGLGRAYVTVNCPDGRQTQSSSIDVTATPVGTFVIAGRVREPGLGGVLDATITDLVTGRTATSDQNGRFSLPVLPSPAVHVRIFKADYETRELQSNSGTEIDAAIQQVVRITAGQSVDPPPLAPNDLPYDVNGVLCEPCRLIRINMPSPGDMTIRLTWQVAGTPASRLKLLVDGQTVTGEGTASVSITILQPREILAYVGAISGVNHTPFKITTTLP